MSEIHIHYDYAAMLVDCIKPDTLQYCAQNTVSVFSVLAVTARAAVIAVPAMLEDDSTRPLADNNCYTLYHSHKL